MPNNRTIRIQRVDEVKYSELQLIADEQGYASVQDLLRDQIDQIIKERSIHKSTELDEVETRLSRLIEERFSAEHQLLDQLNVTLSEFMEEY
ncbi:hypothetical protein [Weissella viridescens]|uniref:hypothetical protein n=1 Tax=Weissella viridescens TaxID=1629 RepID=UPI003AF3170A